MDRDNMVGLGRRRQRRHQDACGGGCSSISSSNANTKGANHIPTTNDYAEHSSPNIYTKPLREEGSSRRSDTTSCSRSSIQSNCSSVELYNSESRCSSKQQIEALRFCAIGLVGVEEADESHYDDRNTVTSTTSSSFNDDLKCLLGDAYNNIDEEEGVDVVDEGDIEEVTCSSADTGAEDDADNDDDDNDSVESRNEKGRLNFSNNGMIYGRKDELGKLHEIYESYMFQASSGSGGEGMTTKKKKKNLPCVTLLSGYSGCGKSTLVHEFIKQLSMKKQRRQRFLFTSGKFEFMHKIQGVPFSALRSLFDFDTTSTMGNTGMQSWKDEADDEQVVEARRKKLVETIGSDMDILCSIMPHLRGLLGLVEEDGGGSNYNDISTKNSRDEARLSSRISWCEEWQAKNNKIEMTRLKFLFKRLVLLFGCTAECPLIIFLDDLQWADEQSLELLNFLLTEDSEEDEEGSALRHLFFVGAYRSNEVNGDDDCWSSTSSDSVTSSGDTSNSNGQLSLASLLRDIRERRTDVQVIELSDLSEDSVGQLISGTLKLPQEEVAPLTGAIYARTLGNPFFTIQALEQLVRKNVLYYDTVMFRWSWNLRDDVLEQILSESLLDMIASKFDKLEDDIKGILSFVSYIGSKFDIQLILDVLSNVGSTDGEEVPVIGALISSTRNKEQLVTMLDGAVPDGFLKKSSVNSDEYLFVHDQIQDVAAGFVSDRERDPLLLRLGTSLASLATSARGEDWMFFTATQHLNSVDPSYHDDESRTRLVALNLQTAELSIALLALSQAAEFAECGLKNLGHDMWVNDHKVTLKLYSICAEAHRGLGKVERADSLCTIALRQAQKLPDLDAYDTLPVQNVMLDILAGKGQKEEALELSLDILGKLGHSFPKREEIQRLKAWTYLQDTKSRYIPSDEHIQALPYITDPMIMDVLELIEKAGSFAYGLGKIHLYVLTRCKQTRWITKHGLTDSSGGALASFANILMHVYGDFDLSVRLADLALVIQTRLKSRYAETRTLNVANFNVLGWVRPIRTRLKYHIQAYDSGMATGNMEGAVTGRWLSYWVHLFSALPLSSLENDCHIYNEKMRKVGYKFYADLGCLTRQAILNLMGRSEHTISLIGEAMDETQDIFSQQKTLEAFTAAHKLFLCVFFGDYESGAKNALERKDSFKNTYIGCWFGLESFYRAICLYAMARETGSQTYKAPAIKLRKELHELVEKGCVNLKGLLRLLDGEHAAMLGKKGAVPAYEEAIKLSVDGGFYQNAGLASERLADYLAGKLGDKAGAKARTMESIGYYTKWGATRKVAMLKQKMTNLA